MANAQEVQKLLAALGNDPYSQSLVNASNAAASMANKNSMEDLNSKGILNSSITKDNSNTIYADAMTKDLLPKLFALKQQRDQEASAERKWQEQLGLQRQQMANEMSKFNQQIGLQRDNMNKYDYQMLQDAKDQKTWGDVNNAFNRRSAFKSNDDYDAQLRKEGVYNQLGSTGYSTLQDMLKNNSAYSGNTPGTSYLNARKPSANQYYSPERRKVRSSLPGVSGFVADWYSHR